VSVEAHSPATVAEEERGAWRKLYLQHMWRVAQCNSCVYIWWVNIMGGEV